MCCQSAATERTRLMTLRCLALPGSTCARSCLRPWWRGPPSSPPLTLPVRYHCRLSVACLFVCCSASAASLPPMPRLSTHTIKCETTAAYQMSHADGCPLTCKSFAHKVCSQFSTWHAEDLQSGQLFCITVFSSFMIMPLHASLRTCCTHASHGPTCEDGLHQPITPMHLCVITFWNVEMFFKIGSA